MDKSFEFMCSTLRNGEYTVTIKKKNTAENIKSKCSHVEMVSVYWCLFA